ncbi:MAG: hypothetical protein QX199_18195 [Methylococcaceae bacterium]
MSHVKSVAGTAKMMEGTSRMMADGMGSMTKMGEAMAQIAQRSKIPAGVATGAVASAGSSAGKTAITKIFTHPLVLLGLGVAVGYYACKYRKSIISTSD